MKLWELIDLLHQIENRHIAETGAIEVECFDEAGVLTSELVVETEYLLTTGTKRVRIVPRKGVTDGQA